MSFSGKALQPKFERMNPAKGVKRMFSMQTVVELIKTLAKAGLVGSVAVYVIWTEREQMTALMYVHPTAAIATGMALIIKCCALIAASLLVIVLIDAPWQLWSFYKKLRMSRQDVKEEHKESEGDPHVKGRIRQQQRSMARSRMMSQVPGADVVVTNPTHYAVALKYQDGKSGAPRVVAKGTGLIAAKIRGLAAEHKVATLEAPALARALYFNVELEREIPVDLYSAVAEVLAWVYQLRNWNKGQGERPIMPTRLKVPTGMDEGPLRSRKH
jgi:flagellar biosynthetic protein FlhB